MDFGSKVNGFGPDISRTVSIGKIGKEQKLMYDLIRKAQQIVLKEVRPGMNGKYLDSVVRNFFKKEGYSDSFKHTVGHGVGLRAIENPIISYELGDQIIPEDCVISIEPGLYMQGKFGIRMDELILITVSGGSVLSAPPDEIDVI
jgi:Xaa-Pro aminopeptidase